MLLIFSAMYTVAMLYVFFRLGSVITDLEEHIQTLEQIAADLADELERQDDEK